jgi:hypothetical protein
MRNLAPTLCGFVLVCCSGERPAAPRVEPQAPASAPASRAAVSKPPPLGPLPGGIDPMRDAAERTDTRRTHLLITGLALSEFQPKTLTPKSLTGFGCHPPESTHSGVQGLVMTTSAKPCEQHKAGEKEPRTAMITIADYIAQARMLSTYEALQKAEQKTPGGRAVRVRKFDAHVTIDPNSKVGHGTIVLQRRFLVSVDLADATVPEVTDFLSTVDLEGLLALRPTDKNTVLLDQSGQPVNAPEKK